MPSFPASPIVNASSPAARGDCRIRRRVATEKPPLRVSAPADWSGWEEGIVILLILAAGVILRWVHLERATVEHFDEGVYASNLLFGEELGLGYPLRHFYAPPLLPWLIEWTMIVRGRLSGQLALFPSLVAGCATIPLLWWFTRRWFGPAAGVGAACAVAFSDVHAVLSRTALTDVLLLFCLLAAISLFAQASTSHRIVDFVLAGLATGLAWWTKYNGWLPLVVSAAGFLAWYLVRRPPPARGRQLALGWATGVGVAVLCWSPYLYALQPAGGYAPIAANHRQYLVGLAGWPESLARQLANLRCVDGTSGNLGLGLAVLLTWLVAHLPAVRGAGSPRAIDWRECAAVIVLSTATIAAAHSMGASTLCLLAGGCGVAASLLISVRRSRTSQSQEPLADGQPAPWLLFSWYLLLFLLTPLYTPYLRLLLPLLGAAWIGAGQLVCLLTATLARCSHRNPSPARKLSRRTVVVAAAAAGLATEFLLGFQPPTAWRDDRRGLAEVASSVRARVNHDSPLPSPDHSGVQPLIYVYGEPALLFHLRALGVPLVWPADSTDLRPAQLADHTIPTFLLSGLHAQQDPNYRRDFAEHADRYQLVQSFQYQPSVLVMLDQQDPRRQDVRQATATVQLLRIRQ